MGCIAIIGNKEIDLSKGNRLSQLSNAVKEYTDNEELRKLGFTDSTQSRYLLSSYINKLNKEDDKTVISPETFIAYVKEEYNNVISQVAIEETEDGKNWVRSVLADTENSGLYKSRNLTVKEEEIAVNVLRSMILDILHNEVEDNELDENPTLRSTVLARVAQAIDSAEQSQSEAVTPKAKDLYYKQYSLLVKIEEALIEESILWGKVLNDMNSYGYNLTFESDMTEEGEEFKNWEDSARFEVDPKTTIGTSIIRDISSTVKQRDASTGMPVYYTDTDIDHIIYVLSNINSVSDVLTYLSILAKRDTKYTNIKNKVANDISMQQSWASAFNNDKLNSLQIELKKQGDNVSKFINYENINSILHVKQARDAIIAIMANSSVETLNELYALERKLKVNSKGKISAHHLFQLLKAVGLNLNDVMNVPMKDRYMKDKNGKLSEERAIGINHIAQIELALKNKGNFPDSVSVSTYDHSNLKKAYDEIKEYLRKRFDSKLAVKSKASLTLDITGYLEQAFKNPSMFAEDADIMFKSLSGNMQYTITKLDNIGKLKKDIESFILTGDTKIQDRLVSLFNLTDNVGNRLLEDLPIFSDIDLIIDDNGELVLDKAELAKFVIAKVGGVVDANRQYKNREYKDLDNLDWNLYQMFQFLQSNEIGEHRNRLKGLASDYYMQPSLEMADRGIRKLISLPKVRSTYDTQGVNSDIFKRIKSLLNVDIQLMDKEYDRLFGADYPHNDVTVKTVAIQHFKQVGERKVFIDTTGLTGQLWKMQGTNVVVDGVAMYFPEFLALTNPELVHANKSINVAALKEDFANYAIVDEALTRYTELFINQEIEAVKSKFKDLESHFESQLNIKSERERTAKLNHTYEEFALNHVLGYMTQQWLLSGHMSYYSSPINFNKRQQQLGSPGRNHEVAPGENKEFKSISVPDIVNDEGVMYDIIDSMLNKFKSLNPAYSKLEAKASKVHRFNIGEDMKLNPLEQQVATYLSPLYDIESTDGFSMITLDEFEKRTKMNGTYEKFKKSIDYYREETSNLFSLPKGVLPLNSLKEFYFGLHYDTDLSIPRPKQVKNSTFVLIPSVIKGTSLEEIHNFLQNNEVNQFNFGSTVKEGNLGDIQLFDRNGKFLQEETLDAVLKANHDLIDTDYYENLFVQQEIPVEKENHANKLGLQISKLMLSNISDAAVYNIANWGDKLGKDVKTDIQELFTDNIIKSRKKFLLELGITEDFDINTNLVPNITKLRNLLVDELNRRGSNNILYSALEIKYMKEVKETLFKNPLALNTSEGKFKTLILSMFTNRITNQKFKGNHSIQMPNLLTKSEQSILDPQTNVNLQKLGLKTGKLKAELKNNVFYLEAYVKKPKGVNSLEELQAANADTMIAYRIPTEDKRSMAVIKIVGFLPDAYGGEIVLPDNIVGQTGSDFDIDTLYLMAYSLKRTNNRLSIDLIDPAKITTLEQLKKEYINYVNSFIPSNLAVSELDGFNEDNDIFMKAMNVRDEARYLKRIANEEQSQLFYELRNDFREGFALHNNTIKLDHAVLAKYEGREDFKALRSYYSKFDKYTKYRAFAELYDSKAEEFEEYVDKMYDAGIEEDAIKQTDTFIQLNTYIRLSEAYHVIMDMYDTEYEEYSDGTTELVGTGHVKGYAELKDKEVATTQIFEHFSKLDDIFKIIGWEEYKRRAEQQGVKTPTTTIQNDNLILDHFLGILSHPDQIVEMHMGASFEEVSKSKRLLAGVQSNKTSYGEMSDASIIISPLTFSGNAVLRKRNLDGKKLKAVSVLNDGALSINQYIGAELSDKLVTTQILHLNTDENRKLKESHTYLDLYDIESLNSTFGTENVFDNNDGTVTVRYRKMGSNNQGGFTNKDGHFITAYASQITANILDNATSPVPQGYDNFTFATVRSMLALGYDYNFITMFFNQRAIRDLATKFEIKDNSVFVTSYGEYLQAIKEIYQYEAYKIAYEEAGSTVKDVINNATKGYGFKLVQGEHRLSIPIGPKSTTSRRIIFHTLNMTDPDTLGTDVSTYELVEAMRLDNSITDDSSAEDKIRNIENQLKFINVFKILNEATKSFTNISPAYRLDKMGAGPEANQTNKFEDVIVKSLTSYFTTHINEVFTDTTPFNMTNEREELMADGIPVVLSMYPRAITPELIKRVFSELGILPGNDTYKDVHEEARNMINKLLEDITPDKSSYLNFEEYYISGMKAAESYLRGVMATEATGITEFAKSINIFNYSRFDASIKSWVKNKALMDTWLMQEHKIDGDGKLTNRTKRLLSLTIPADGTIEQAIIDGEFKSKYSNNIVELDTTNKSDIKGFEELSLLEKVILVEKLQKRRGDDESILKYIKYGNIGDNLYKNGFVRLRTEAHSSLTNEIEELFAKLWAGTKIENLLATELIEYTILVDGLLFNLSSLGKFINPNILSNRIMPQDLNTLESLSGLALSSEFEKSLKEYGYDKTKLGFPYNVIAMNALRDNPNATIPILNNTKITSEHLLSIEGFSMTDQPINSVARGSTEKTQVVKRITKDDELITLQQFKSKADGKSSYAQGKFQEWVTDKENIHKLVTAQNAYVNKGDLVTIRVDTKELGATYLKVQIDDIVNLPLDYFIALRNGKRLYSKYASKGSLTTQETKQVFKLAEDIIQTQDIYNRENLSFENKSDEERTKVTDITDINQALDIIYKEQIKQFSLFHNNPETANNIFDNRINSPEVLKSGINKVVSFKTIEVADFMRHKYDSSRAYYVYQFDVEQSKMKSQKAATYSVLIPLNKLLQGETTEASIVPSNNIYDKNGTIKTIESQITTIVENKQTLIDTYREEKERIANSKKERKKGSTRYSIVDAANVSSRFKNNTNVDKVREYVEKGRGYIASVDYRNNALRQVSELSTSIQELDFGESIVDLTTAMTTMLAMQQIDIDYVNTELPSLIKRINIYDNEEKTLTSVLASDISAALLQVHDALAAIEVGSSLKPLVPSNKKEEKYFKVINNTINSMRKANVNTSALKRQLDDLYGRFLEIHLTQFSNNPNIVNGLVSVTSIVEDENLGQLYLKGAAYSNNPLVATIVKEYAMHKELAKMEAKKQAVKLDSLIREYTGGSVDLTDTEWDQMFEYQDGVKTNRFLQDTSYANFVRYRQQRIEQLQADYRKEHRRISDKKAFKVVSEQLSNEGYTVVMYDEFDERRKKVMKDYPVKGKGLTDAQIEANQIVRAEWVKIHADGDMVIESATPGWRYRRPNPNKEEFKARNKDGLSKDEFMKTSKLAKIFKYVSETFVENANLSNTHNGVSRGMLPAMIEQENDGWRDIRSGSDLARKLGYRNPQQVKSITMFDGTNRFNLDFQFANNLVNRELITDIKQRKNETNDEFETRVVNEVNAYLEEYNKYIPRTEFTDLARVETKAQAITIAKLISSGKHIKQYSVADSISDAKITAQEINKLFKSDFTAAQIAGNLITYVNKVIYHRNKTFTLENQSFDVKAVFNLFAITSNLYKHKKDMEDRLLIAQDFLANKEIYGHLQTTGIGTIQYIKKTFNKLGRRTEGGRELTQVKGKTVQGVSTTEKHFNMFLEMVFYENFEANEGDIAKVARVVQNYTSAKGMMLNINAAINNVFYGKMQMAQEYVAKEFTDNGEKGALASMAFAARYYTSGIASYWSDEGDYATTIQSALIKRFDVVQLQDEKAFSLGYQKEKGGSNLKRHASLYLLHHAGEHLMQNQMMFTMLDSHRIIDGKIKSLTDYVGDRRIKIINELGYQKELAEFIDATLEKDAGNPTEISRIIQLFVYANLSKADFNDFVKRSKDLKKSDRAEFIKHTKVIDVFELKDGFAQVKKINGAIPVSDEQLALFKRRIEMVNHRIHGIYNKFDAGVAQHYALGRLALHFHKWIKELFDKRFGSKFGKAFWIEGMDSKNKGTYVVMAKIIYDVFKYTRNLQLIYHTLDEQDKAAAMSVITEFATMMFLGLAFAAGKSFDLDDEEDNRIISMGFYQLTRMYNEAAQFTPYGMMDETSRLMASPIAAQTSIGQILSILEAIGTGVIDGKWVKESGVNKDRSTVGLNIINSIPIYTHYDKIIHNTYNDYNKRSSNIWSRVFD